MRTFSLRKALIVVAAFLLSALSVYLGVGEALRVSVKPSEYIGLTFSILAATLFAVISIVGDPSMLLPGSWRSAFEQAKDIQLRLLRLTYLFVLYLMVLGLLVVSEIVEAKCLTAWYWIFDLLGFTAVLAFLASLWLPFEIKTLQLMRLNQEIEARRRPRERSSESEVSGQRPSKPEGAGGQQ